MKVLDLVHPIIGRRKSTTIVIYNRIAEVMSFLFFSKLYDRKRERLFFTLISTIRIQGRCDAH
jgi:hypothetical protein